MILHIEFLRSKMLIIQYNRILEHHLHQEIVLMKFHLLLTRKDCEKTEVKI